MEVNDTIKQTALGKTQDVRGGTEGRDKRLGIAKY
jgi:hypothetical protein